ncbi:sigma-54-dependent Fis family transcriptional regulator [bacterium]|nr:sigma-54-dependent Fis family transcriptional regulator [bacterium]
MAKPLVLIVDDDPEVVKALERVMGRAGYRTLLAGDTDEAREALAVNEVDLFLVDLVLPSGSGLELITGARMRDANLAVIVLTGHGSVQSAVEAMRAGAYDYLTKPVNPEELLLQVERALENRRMRLDLESLRGRLDERLTGEGVIAVSPQMKRIFEMVDQLAKTDITVLVTGPSGVGKELVADAIQHRSNRRDGPYIKLHCAALSEGLLESELFGHERGAFTGAIRRHAGAFERAHDGTLFLDEISEIPRATQVKLLRVLQDQRFERVGGEETLQVDVRLIAATNADPAEQMRAGRFREDLYYRLKKVQIYVPPIAERPEDLLPMISRFVSDAARAYDRPVTGVEPTALDLLLTYDWPGNVRELKNTLEGMVALAKGDELTVEDLPPEIKDRVAAINPTSMIRVPVGWTMEQVEREVIRRTLAKNAGNRTQTAKVLGIGLRTLHRKINEYELK